MSKLPASSENTTWSWDAGTSTGTFAWSSTSFNSTQLFGSGNYSAYTTLKLETTSEGVNHFRIIIKYSNGAGQTTINPVATGNTNINLTDYATLENLANVSSIRLSGANDGTGDITVSRIYLEGPDIVYIEASEIFEAPAGTVDVKNLSGTNTGWASTVTYPKEFAVQGNAFGDGNGSTEGTHVNIDGYDYICFNVTTATNNTAGLRVWLWDDVNKNVVTLYTKPIADYKTADYTTYSKITGVGTYVVKVSGYKYLKGVKADNDYGAAASVVSMAYMCTGEPVVYTSTGKYSLVGEATGSVSLTAALADASATFYDATGVTGTGVDLTSVANKNALFKANAGVLANTKNVIVGSTCANLELTDEKPFKAPVAFTATNALFEKTVTAAGYATLVLPFNADVADGVEAYNIESESAGVLTTTVAEAIVANKPVMIKAVDASYSFKADDVAVPATPAGAQQNGLLYGVYEITDVPTTNGYVLQKHDAEVNFYKAATGQKVNAFRAYLATAAVEARALSFDFNTTGVNEVKVNSENAEVYNLNGQRVAAPQKGLYIVGAKKVIVK